MQRRPGVLGTGPGEVAVATVSTYSDNTKAAAQTSGDNAAAQAPMTNTSWSPLPGQQMLWPFPLHATAGYWIWGCQVWEKTQSRDAEERPQCGEKK